MSHSFTIKHASSLEDVTDATRLFETYAKSIGIDLSFQDFATEMSSMPGKYAPPTGALLLARNATGAAIGCVGLRPLGDGYCEMKRLYVAPEGRGLGLGGALAGGVVDEARRLGYRAMRLDTLPHMEPARASYRRLGFKEVGAYYETPLEGTIFMELDLRVEN